MGLKFLHKTACLAGGGVVLSIAVGRICCFAMHSVCILLDSPFLLAAWLCLSHCYTHVAMTWMHAASHRKL